MSIGDQWIHGGTHFERGILICENILSPFHSAFDASVCDREGAQAYMMPSQTHAHATVTRAPQLGHLSECNVRLDFDSTPVDDTPFHLPKTIISKLVVHGLLYCQLKLKANQSFLWKRRLKQRERVSASLTSAWLSDASQESRWKAACLGRRSTERRSRFPSSDYCY